MRTRDVIFLLGILVISSGCLPSAAPDDLPTQASTAAPITLTTPTPPPDPQPAATATTGGFDLPTPIVVPSATVTALPASPVPSLTPSPVPSPTETPVPSPTPTILSGVTIDGLRGRDYPGGPIEFLRTLETTDAYTRYYIAYPSDGLRITGILQIPPGEGPFPVIILNHGYHERGSYWAGSGTWMAAEFLNRRGYITVAPDYRSWGESDWGPSLFHTGLVTDVLNLIESLWYVPQADPSRLGMWGHSMGGGMTTKILTIDPRVRAAVLYGTNSGDDADLIARWGRGCLPGETQSNAHCNPAEVIPADLSPDLVQAYLAAAADPDILRQIAPIYHLENVSAPVQIHIGTADGQELNATPPEWSFKIHEALQAAGKQSELFVYEGQGHLFQGQAWVDMMSRVADFFDQTVR